MHLEHLKIWDHIFLKVLSRCNYYVAEYRTRMCEWILIQLVHEYLQDTDILSWFGVGLYQCVLQFEHIFVCFWFKGL